MRRKTLWLGVGCASALALVVAALAVHAANNRYKEDTAMITVLILEAASTSYYELSTPPHALPRVLDDLTQPSFGQGPLLMNVYDDPWGHAYLYQAQAASLAPAFRIWSAGHDGISGTEDDIDSKTIKRLSAARREYLEREARRFMRRE